MMSMQLYEDDKSVKVKCGMLYGRNRFKTCIWFKTDTTKEFPKALEKGSIEEYLNYIEVFEGDVINIPAGIIHAIGEGILLAEVQQNSNNTYRVYDYNRVDKNGKKRPLHIQKALDVIDFSGSIEYNKSGGTSVQTNDNYKVTKLVENSYFSTELYHINGEVEEIADGSRFYIYLFIEGEATICYGFRGCLNGNMNNGHFSEKMNIRAGESIFIPAFMESTNFQ